MKARKVPGVDPDGTLADNTERIIRTRVDELHSFVPAALDPREVAALHDLRIAAKRVRYLLELTAFCFGSYARTGAKAAKGIQDLVGEIHDCDVMVPRVLEHLADLRAADAAVIQALAGDAEDLPPGLAARAPNRDAYRGLEVLAATLQARRGLLFERFLALWRELEDERFRDRLEAALAERPAAPAPLAPPVAAATPAPLPAPRLPRPVIRPAVRRRTDVTGGLEPLAPADPLPPLDEAADENRIPSASDPPADRGGT